MTLDQVLTMSDDEVHDRAQAAQNAVIDRYTWHVENIRAMLSNLTEYIDDFGGVAPDDVNWTHVGSMAEMAEQLRQLCEFVGIFEDAEPIDSEVTAWKS